MLLWSAFDVVKPSENVLRSIWIISSNFMHSILLALRLDIASMISDAHQLTEKKKKNQTSQT